MFALFAALLAPAFAADLDCDFSADRVECHGEQTLTVELMEASGEPLVAVEATEERAVALVFDLDLLREGGVFARIDAEGWGSELGIGITHDHRGIDTVAIGITHDHHGTEELAVTITNDHYGTDEVGVIIDNDHYGTDELAVNINNSHLVVELDAEGRLLDAYLAE